MLKRISPSQVEMGMFVHKLEGSWFKHPFWKSKFILDDPGTLDDLRDADIDAVVIDISKGCDVLLRRGDAPAVRSAPVSAPKPLLQRRRVAAANTPAQFDYRSTAPQTMAREFGHAARTADRGRKVVTKVFLQMRLGKTIPAQAVEPVIEDIFASVQRNPHAFNGLMRCKQDNEFLYRHALACSALMISLARALKLSPNEIREAGLAGLMFDVGVNLLPVDLADFGNDHRRLPAELLMQHAELGANFLEASGLPAASSMVARHHHERSDGQGYPARLNGSDIPLLSRMATICDAYDELASFMPGSGVVDPGTVLQTMSAQRGRFDPEVFAAFVQCMGTFPIGTFVELKSARLALVIDQNPTDISKPTVRPFFSLTTGKSLRSEDIDLANCFGADEIVGLADLSRFDPEETMKLRTRMLASLAKGG